MTLAVRCLKKRTCYCKLSLTIVKMRQPPPIPVLLCDLSPLVSESVHAVKVKGGMFVYMAMD